MTADQREMDELLLRARQATAKATAKAAAAGTLRPVPRGISRPLLTTAVTK